MRMIIRVSSVLMSLMLLFSCQNPTLLRQQDVEKTAGYYTESINNARQGYLAITMPDRLELKKETSLRGLANHTVLNISDQLALTTRNGFLHLLNIRDLEGDQNAKISPAISTAPTYYGNLLFIASELGEEGLKAYDLHEGEIIWAKKGYLSRSSPVVANNFVFHSALNGKVLALNVSTGEKIWERTLKDKIISSMAYSDGYLTAISINGTVRTFDSTSGSELWSLDIDQPVHTHPVIKGNRIIITTYEGTVLILNLKKGTIENELNYEVPFYHAVSVDERSIYLPLSDGYVVSLDVTNLKEMWASALDGPLSTGILATSNKVYCGTARKYYYVLDKETGEIIQDIELEGRPRSIPLALNNRLYITYERKMIALLSGTED